MNQSSPETDEQTLRTEVEKEPSNWQARRNLAHHLYDKQSFEQAAEVIWEADPIPSTDIDLAFAARVLSKAKPRWAIRLLTAVLEQNRGKAVQNLGMANALLHHGMVLQAARFYGAALEADPTFANPDLEHFVLWVDDEKTLWGDFEKRRPVLGDLPWMIRDAQEAKLLEAQMSGHTTPVHVPKLTEVPGESLKHPMYQQQAARNAKITPPPAVTIPIDRVDPKYRRYDENFGAETGTQEDASFETTPKRPLTQSAPQPVYRPPMPVPTSRLEESTDAPPRKTEVMPLKFPEPTTSAQKIKAPEISGEATPSTPATEPASPVVRRLIVPGLKRD